MAPTKYYMKQAKTLTCLESTTTIGRRLPHWHKKIITHKTQQVKTKTPSKNQKHNKNPKGSWHPRKGMVSGRWVKAMCQCVEVRWKHGGQWGAKRLRKALVRCRWTGLAEDDILGFVKTTNIGAESGGEWLADGEEAEIGKIYDDLKQRWEVLFHFIFI